MPIQIAEAPTEQQEARERELVRVRDPHQRSLGEPQIRTDTGQRHDHDRSVEHDHEHTEAEHDERPPALALIERMVQSVLMCVLTHDEPRPMPQNIGLAEAKIRPALLEENIDTLHVEVWVYRVLSGQSLESSSVFRVISVMLQNLEPDCIRIELFGGSAAD